MDNASKALIMAGAILVSIGIVGVGVYLYSSSQSISSMGQQQLDAVAAQTANSVLRNYSGTKVRGSVVNEFKGYIDVYNAQDVFPTDIKIASSKFDNSVSGTLVRKNDPIDSNAYYAVSLRDDNGDGYYDLVQIVRRAGVLGDIASGDSGEIIDLTELGEENPSEEVSGETEIPSGEGIEPNEENEGLEEITSIENDGESLVENSNLNINKIAEQVEE